MARRPLSLQQAIMAAFNPVANGPLGQRASNESQLRYLPQIEALLALRGQTALTGRQNVQQIRRGGLTAAGGIRQVRNSFQQQLADTPAPTSEAAAHLGLTRDAVTGALAQMQANQYAGIAGGVSQARRATQASQAQIVQQLLQAAQQGSLYNTSEYDSLSADRAKARQSARQARATLNAGLLKAGYDATGRPIPGIFGRIHPPKAPHAPVDGIDYQTYLGMTPEQRRAAHKAFSTAGGKNGAGGKPVSPSDRVTADKAMGTIDRISSAFSTLAGSQVHYNPATGHTIPADKNGQYPKWVKTRAYKPHEIVSIIEAQFGTAATPIIIHAANQKAHGGIDHGTYKRLRQRYPGLNLPKGWVVSAGTGGGLGGIAGGNGRG